MNSQARYAVYFVPEPGTALARFGEAWFGRDRPGTAGARLYGLHATLKPPFRLAEGHDSAGLFAAATAFAGRRPPLSLAPLRLDLLDGFLALRPSRHEPALHALAEACLRIFDPFRAPAPPEETARRRQAGLTPRQEAHLAAWGYPYVLADYRFHVTLTDRLAADQQTAMRAELAPLLAAALDEPLSIASLALCMQPAAGQPFTLARRFPLVG